MMQLLRDAIKSDSRSQNQIAKACGMDNSRLSRFVRSERDITFESACRLFEVLGVRIVLPTGAAHADADEPAPAKPTKRKPPRHPGRKGP
jgi:transcriptional regulator with XRE-family HTH domain